MKIGKTEFCTLAPKSLIFAFEMGTNARPNAYVMPIQKWVDFKGFLQQLEGDAYKEKFETICIDTVAIAWSLCEKYICTKNGVQKINEIPYGGGYSQLSQEFEEALRKITMMGYGLIMTCHLKESADDAGHVLAAKPDLPDRCYRIVNGLADIIAVITQEWDSQGNSLRWLQTRATPTIAAGTRFKYLEPRIPFGYNELVEALGRAIDKEAEGGAVVVDKKEIIKEEKLDFNKIYNEAKEVWTTLISRAATDEQKERIALEMSKKVEIVFGRKIKLSEVTEDQVDMLNLALVELKKML